MWEGWRATSSVTARAVAGALYRATAPPGCGGWFFREGGHRGAVGFADAGLPPSGRALGWRLLRGALLGAGTRPKPSVWPALCALGGTVRNFVGALMWSLHLSVVFQWCHPFENQSRSAVELGGDLVEVVLGDR